MIDFGDFFKKLKKRQTLVLNKIQGEVPESIMPQYERAKGKIVKRTGHGHDFKESEIDILTGKVKNVKYVEYKSTETAKLTKLQKKKKKEYGHQYVVDRPSGRS